MIGIGISIGNISNGNNNNNNNDNWNLASFEYTSFYLSVADKGKYPVDIVFNPDGDKMYLLEAETQQIYQYTLLVPWDISTAIYDSTFFPLPYFPRRFIFSLN